MMGAIASLAAYKALKHLEMPLTIAYARHPRAVISNPKVRFVISVHGREGRIHNTQLGALCEAKQSAYFRISMANRAAEIAGVRVGSCKS